MQALDVRLSDRLGHQLPLRCVRRKHTSERAAFRQALGGPASPAPAHATHVVYHYGTPVAWIDGRDGGWVVPDEDYSPMTSGVQTRAAELLKVSFRQFRYKLRKHSIRALARLARSG